MEEYYHLLDENILPVYRGHILNNEDLIVRKHILNLMCQFEASWKNDYLCFDELPNVLIRLKEMKDDGLLTINSKTLTVSQKGYPFVRNICMAFDGLLQRKQPDTKLFSMTI